MPDHDAPNDDPDTASLSPDDSAAESPTSSSDGASSAAPSPASADAETPSSEADASSSVEDLHFEDEDLADKLRRASEEQLDNAPFGIIKVDDEGVVEFFNQYESDLSGMDPSEVKGRNFFTQVAPCTNNRLFRGRFKKGVRRGELDETFTYTYTYKMRPTLVDVHLYRDEAGNNWILVQKY